MNFDSRTTLNVMGVRHINDFETLIVGGNSFYDYELDMNINDLVWYKFCFVVGLRANQYKAKQVK